MTQPDPRFMINEMRPNDRVVSLPSRGVFFKVQFKPLITLWNHQIYLLTIWFKIVEPDKKKLYNIYIKQYVLK